MFRVNINLDDVNHINTHRQVPLAVSRNFMASKLTRNHIITGSSRYNPLTIEKYTKI